MTNIKIVFLMFALFLFAACGGTKNEQIDYSQVTDAEMMELGDKEMMAGNFNKAIETYNKVLLDFPTSNLHIDVQLKIAEAYGKMDKFENQMDQLLRLVRENIVPERVPQIYVQIGKWYERAAQFNPGIISSDSIDYVKAISFYDDAFKYPDSDDNESKSAAVYRRALVEAKIGLIDDAIARYKTVSNLFPNTNHNILAQIKLKDPANLTELATTDSALAEYREILGLVKEEPVAQDLEPMEEEPPAKDTTLDKTIENIDKEESAEPQEEMDSEELPNENIDDQEMLTPAAEDTTGGDQ
jgi:tetratricopeptide (TPR) repeat protein